MNKELNDKECDATGDDPSASLRTTLSPLNNSLTNIFLYAWQYQPVAVV
ncbi:MAG TPA: hypothetical protein VJ111_10395 [Chitinophagaceae bacterium]|nr:hypothetical protein [Chitinophagaceae bacterium]